MNVHEYNNATSAIKWGVERVERLSVLLERLYAVNDAVQDLYGNTCEVSTSTCVHEDTCVAVEIDILDALESLMTRVESDIEAHKDIVRCNERKIMHAVFANYCNK